MLTHKSLSLLLIVFFSIFGLSVDLHAKAQELNAAFSLQRAFIDVAKSLKKSVVNIRVEKEVEGSIRWFSPGGKEDEGVEEFFRKFFKAPGFKMPEPDTYKTQAAGSGVIIDKNGIILTNNHVIKDSSSIIVKLYDGSEFAAKIIGQDPQTDLAVIKIDAGKDLDAAKFADSEKVEVGQWCIAVGNPLGLEQTVTVGVVSAVGRSGIGATPIEDFIQTDASINPGNSGGPLVDLNGEVIGINTLIFNAPGSGIGFAIPSNLASRISSQIIENGKVQRPYLGITMQPVTKELAEHFDLQDHEGAVIIQRAEDSPAEKAGLKAMDIIRFIDGQKMKSPNEVQKYVLSKEIGTVIKLEILRNGKMMQLDVKLQEMPESYGLAANEVINRKSYNKANSEIEKLGFAIQQLDEETAKSMGLDSTNGVLVTSVKAGSPAAEGGLMVGDVIIQVNSREIKTEKDVVNAIKTGAKNNSSVLVVQRGGSPLFLVINHKN
ncbi:MAG: DegQ family serine endoprotease [Candidatus Rifleibacteriota bacterium]